MRFPVDIGHRGLQIVVSMNASTVDISRPTDGSSREAMGEQLPDDGTVDETADVWLFSQRQNPTDVEFGARVDGTLTGLSMPEEDVQERDRIDYHGEEYEVVDLTTFDDGGAVLQMIGLDKRINT